MKLNRKLFVTAAALVLAIVCFIPSTFSWYNHSGALSGRVMKYTRTELPISAGDITLSTKKYRMEQSNGVNTHRIYYDVKGNKIHEGNALTSDSVAGGSSQYYGTVITNTSTAPAYVNLYTQNLTNSTTAYVGTIAPSLTQKGISSSVHLTNKNIVRVYVQWADANGWKAAGANHYVVYTTKDGAQMCKKIETADPTNYPYQINLANDTDNILSNTATYYTDLPENVIQFYFATDANAQKFNPDTLVVSEPYYRTRTITDIHTEVLYVISGEVDDTTWNVQYTTKSLPGGISVISCFDRATINAGQNAYITLTEGTHYTGASVSYASSNAYLTVDANTGFVSASANFATHTSESPTVDTAVPITTTITGSLGDTLLVITDVTNPALMSTVPVAMNVYVPGKTRVLNDNNEYVDVNGTVEIVWYIRNEGSSACGFDGIYYTK